MNKKQVFDKLVADILQFSVSPEVAKFIAAQSCLESDFGTSRICLENHNWFGMKNPHLRITMSTGIQNGHAVYDCYADSLIDYMLWLQYFDFNQKDLEYLSRFKRCLKESPYCPNPDYIFRIESIYNQYK